MGYALAKVAGWALSPLVIALALWAVALWLGWRGRRRSGAVLGLAGFIGLWVVATPWMAHHLAQGLEQRFPAIPVARAPVADAILVLGGALGGASPPVRPSFDLGSAADRIWHAAALFRAGKAQWVLVAGGNQSGQSGLQLEAEAIREMLLTLGVPDSAIRMEGVSRNTIENAQESRALVKAVGAKRVILVTSAMHMPRALANVEKALRNEGVAVLPSSTDVEGLPDTLHPVGRWLPDAFALALSTRALKEYLALLPGWAAGYA